MPFRDIAIPPSANLASPIRYDEDTQTLLIQFQRGPVYQYDQVTQQEALGFVTSGMKPNLYFNQTIRDVKPYRRIS